MNKPLILISNDDSVDAPGLHALIEMMKDFGNLLVVAPSQPQSGMSHALTSNQPLRLKKIKESEGLTIYSCNGTPADCVKIAMNFLIKQKPDLIVSGINHGSNSSISIIYSGTMAAAAEGALYHIPAIGFSLCNHALDADFSACIQIGKTIVKKVMENGLAEGIALNINFPDLPLEKIKGIRVCRQNKGYWNEQFDSRLDPQGSEYFWLAGYYVNEEPESKDTDEAYLEDGYVSIVPSQFDFTAYNQIQDLKKIFE